MANVIYKILNQVNGNFYIGSAVNALRRRARHWSELRNNKHNNRHLQAAWNKYGETAFVFIILEEVPADKNHLDRETEYLRECVGKPNCYNIGVEATAPALGLKGELSPTWGYQHTDEDKKKISDNHYMRTEEGRRRKSESMSGEKHPKYGVPMLGEQKQAISKKLKELYADGMDHPMQGLKHTENSKQKISKSRKGKHAGVEHYRFGQTLSEEVRKKIGDTQRGISKGKGRKVSPEGLARIHAAANAGAYDHWLGRQHTAKSKRKMSRRVIEVSQGVCFYSLTDALYHYDMKMPTMKRALDSGAPISRGPLTGLQFRYVDE